MHFVFFVLYLYPFNPKNSKRLKEESWLHDCGNSTAGAQTLNPETPFAAKSLLGCNPVLRGWPRGMWCLNVHLPYLRWPTQDTGAHAAGRGFVAIGVMFNHHIPCGQPHDTGALDELWSRLVCQGPRSGCCRRLRSI